MRRNASSTIELLKDLSARGVQVKPRRLESWSQEKLGPLPTIPHERRLEHYACLAEFSTSGRTADDAAVTLAARGFANERALEVMRNSLGAGSDIDQGEAPQIDISTAASGDSDFADLERIALFIERFLERTVKAAISLANAPNPNRDALFKSVHLNASFSKQGSDLLIRPFDKTTERPVPKWNVN